MTAPPAVVTLLTLIAREDPARARVLAHVLRVPQSARPAPPAAQAA